MDKGIHFRSHTVREGGQPYAEVRLTSDVPQGSVLGPLVFLAYVNDIWRNMESTIRLFADGCVIYKKMIKRKTWKNFRKTWTGWGSGRLKMR